MVGHVFPITVQQTELLRGNKSTIHFDLEGLAAWSGEHVADSRHPGPHNDFQEPPRKRVKLEEDDASALAQLDRQAQPSAVSIPISRNTLCIESDSPATREFVKSSGIEEGEPIQVSLLFVTGSESQDAALGLAPLYPKASKTRLNLTLGQRLDPSLLEDLKLVAQLHHRSRMTLRPSQAHATVSLRWTFPSDSAGAICTLNFTVWWPDGASCLGGNRKESLDSVILSRYFDIPDLRAVRSKHCSAQDFYDSVHVPESSLALPAELETHGLETELYPFQKRAVQWMREREGVDTGAEAYYDLSNLPFEQSADVDGKEIFMSSLEGVVATRSRLEQRREIRGGILSEEMGLGKTCEVLALICMNQRPAPKDFTFTIYEHLKPTRATLIVTPTTILQQWMDEIRRHTPHLIVEHYKGVSALAKEKKEEKDAIDSFENADIVLVTYNVLASEVHYALEPPDRSLRKKNNTPARKRSPLVQMHWWRTVLDEAQMVESGVSKAATTATLIPRYNAWAVSGTPVKRDVQDLRGLLIFLQCEPFASSNEIWRRLVYHYESHFKDYFKRLFSTIALRHTKDKIRGELKLPPQRRLVVTMPFTAVEEQNYQTLFAEMAYECGLAMDGSPLTNDWDPSDSRVIEAMRTWLVRLRQTCLHPQVGGRNRRALGKSAGPLRTVEEVLAVMIDQNEAAIRTETRLSISALCLKGHILAYAKDVPNRAEQALELYQIALSRAEASVSTAREELQQAGGTGIDDISEDGSDDENEETSGHAKRGKLRNNLRNSLELQHMCEFFVGTAYFQIKSATEGIAEGDDKWKELEEQEVLHYDKAKMVRKEVLRETASKAEQTMRDVSSNVKERIDVATASTYDLGFHGGIESQRVLEKTDRLMVILERQTILLIKWRSKVSDLLLKRLVDVDDEETTGEEYETSTKEQDEMYIYFDAYRALVADRLTCITGQVNTLVNHEMQQLVRESKLADHDDEHEGREPPETRQFLRDLLGERKAIQQKDDGLISLRGLLHEARTVESSLQWQDSRSGRSQAEALQIRRLMAHLQKLTDTYNKLQTQLVKDQELFRAAMNQRLEFYRQLQQISDAVAPYKEELDETLDRTAFDAASERHEANEKQLATLQSKRRFLVHLRDESSGEAERICVICQSTFELGVLTVCGHQFCKECIGHWWRSHQTCPVCKRRLRSADFHNVTYKPQELSAHEENHATSTESDDTEGKTLATNTPEPSDAAAKVYASMSASDLSAIKSIDLPGSKSFGTKIDTISRHLLHIRRSDPGSKTLIFSQYRDFLGVLSSALSAFGISHIPISAPNSVPRFREDASIEAFLLDAKTDSSGLNLVNATNVLLCEPLVNPALELQAIARVHRIGQTRPTNVFMYLVKDTVEQGVYQVSVARRMQLLSQRGAARSGTATPADVDRAERLEVQAGGLERLLGKGRAGGEQVRHEDLWTCLFGAGRSAPRLRDVGVMLASAERDAATLEVERFVRTEAAVARSG